MTYIVGDSFGDSPNKLTTETRHFEQALRVDRPPSALSFATQDSLPATQGQRSEYRVDAAFICVNAKIWRLFSRG